MRHHPLIKFIKEKIKNKRIWSVQVICGSYLPHWRKNINYTNSYSSKKNGGGVLLDLSHELDYVSWIFGKIKTNFSFNKKISNLKINSDDYLTLFGIIKKKIFVQINLNYFMRNATRRMYIDGLNVSYDLDLIKNTINYYENGKKYYKKLKNYDLNEMYINQHKDIITGKKKVTCKYTEAEYIMNLVKDIKDKNFA